MGTKRFFSGTRDGSKPSINSRVEAKIRRIELERGGKLPLNAADRYKMAMEMRLDEHRSKAGMSAYSTFMLKGAASGAKKMSRRAEQALKEMASKKASKESKRMAQMVVIKPRWYGSTGQINAKGIVYDHVSNITLKVDARTGKVKTRGGWTVGKYKPKSFFHGGMMEGWIKKHSPYHIQLQKMRLQQQLAAMQQLQQQGVTVHGIPVDPAQLAQYMQQMTEAHSGLSQQLDAQGNVIGGSELNSIGRTNADVTAWGVRSGNVWGTFGENAWGGFADNAWGGTNNNVWGGIGDSSSLWGEPGRRVFSSAGNGKNYIKMWAGMAKTLFLGGRNRSSRSRGGTVSRGAGAQMRFAGPVGARSGGARPGAAPRGRR